MKPKHHVILYSCLAVTLLVAVFLTINFGLQANAATQVVEDLYTQRLLESAEQLQAIGVKLGKLSVTTDPGMLCDLLTGISKQADGAVANLGALPLSHVAMGETVKFCNQLSDYALGLALTLAGGGELSQEQRDQLADMQSQCTLLMGQFAIAQDAIMAENLLLRPQDNVYYQQADMEKRPLEKVADKDNGMEYPTMIYDGAFSDARHFGVPKALGTQPVDQVQAQELAVRFLGAGRVKEAQSAAETQGNIPAYGVSLTLTDNLQLTAEVTKTGGKLLWMVPEHASFTPKLTLEECAAAAQAFLEEHGYGPMEANHYQVYDGLAVINYVAVQDGVLLYPDLLKLQLRMDTGEVVGLEANNYLMNHASRENLQPTLTAPQAQSHVSKQLDVQGIRLCLIPYKGDERLCYEVAGTCQENEYRVYIDANTGEEAQVLLIIKTQEGVLSASSLRQRREAPSPRCTNGLFSKPQVSRPPVTTAAYGLS